jgi:hypothetical protein
MTLFLSYFLTNPLHYFKVDEEWLPAGFDEEELFPVEFDEEESLTFLQASTHSRYAAVQRLESAVIFIQTSPLPLQLLTHSSKLFPCDSDAIEMPAKEKNNKYEIMTKYEIMENILNCFIIRPPLIYKRVS